LRATVWSAYYSSDQSTKSWGQIQAKPKAMQTTTSRLGRGVSLLLAYAMMMSGAQAELPPSAYKERQSQAPEHLVIKARSVSKRETNESQWKQTDFTVEAEVQKVHRSATKLMPGAVIQIRYSQRHYSQPIAGPSEVPALKEGQVCPAYLSGNGKVYSPAAGGYSFETVN
jgi:hypothetical protein